MPLYEYQCSQCNIEIEKYRKMSEREDPVECPKCQENMGIMVSDIAGYRINWIRTEDLK